MDSSILGPHIFYHPLTNIGILSFTIEPVEKYRTLENVIALNYSMRTFCRADSATFCIPFNTHPGASEQEKAIEIQLASFQNGHSALVSEGYHTWTIDVLLKVLLQDVPQQHDRLLSPNRLQAFMFVQTRQVLDESMLLTASFRLRRLYSQQYHPDKHFLHRGQETYQSFREVHFGASIEGCVAILNGTEHELAPFLKDYSLVIKNRFVWIYLLAYYQRLMLIDMNDKLSRVYDKRIPGKDKLLQLSADLSRIQLHSVFSQVSYFTQHNEFYDFCKHNLKLTEMLSDVKNKLLDVDRILQRQLAEEEKVHVKKRERKDRVLEVMIAALLIPEIVFEFLSTLAHAFEVHFPTHGHHPLSHILLIFSSILLLTVIPFAFRIYREYARVALAFLRRKELPLDAGFKKTFIDKN
jgi:hypothetical protein